MTRQLPPKAVHDEPLTHANITAFRELARNAFNEDLFRNGGNWEDCDACVAEHWEDLLDILSQEIYERSLDWIEQQEAKAGEEDPSLSAAERNPRLT